MTFMRKFLDMLNMDNWGKNNTPNIQKNSALMPKENMPKWLSIRDDEAIKIERQTLNLKNVTIYFDNGVISDVIPDVYSYYEAQFYNIDGIIYDSYSVNSIKTIPTPDYSKVKPTGTPIYSLEYILNMRASQERKKKNNEIAYVLLEKSLDLMKYSQTIYSEKQILRIVNWLYEDGKFLEAEKKESILRKDFPYSFDNTLLHKDIFFKTLQSCKESDTDYIFCSSHQGTCSECAKFQCRVYNISGKDKRFPKLPDIVYQYGGFHLGCRHDFYPFFLNFENTIKNHNLKKYDVFVHSNRPFIDDRNDYDKKLYFEYLEKRRKSQESAQNRKIYYLLKEKLPDIMPKSCGGFTKMKNANSEKYKKIVKAAHEIGIDI